MKTLSLPPSFEQILEVARWAPSGDNAQPWSFRATGDSTLEIRVHHQPGNVYEYRQGEPTLISAGALLENIRIASAHFGKKANWRWLNNSGGTDLIELTLVDAQAQGLADLFEQIPKRSVDRRAYQTKKLGSAEKAALVGAVDENITLEWYERFSDRRKLASLTQAATDIRLRIPETFEIHNRIIDWENLESADAIPSRALGLDAVTLKLMRWSLAKRSRTNMANALGSPFFASMQMDVLPGLSSACYFAFRVSHHPTEAAGIATQLLKIGQSVQRFWLTATKLGLVLQPCLAALAFAHYGASGSSFTVHPGAVRKAVDLAKRADHILGKSRDILFLGRIGWPRSALASRSVRKPLSALIAN